jgi:hypothetical protein
MACSGPKARGVSGTCPCGLWDLPSGLPLGRVLLQAHPRLPRHWHAHQVEAATGQAIAGAIALCHPGSAVGHNRTWSQCSIEAAAVSCVRCLKHTGVLADWCYPLSGRHGRRPHMASHGHRDPPGGQRLPFLGNSPKSSEREFSAPWDLAKTLWLSPFTAFSPSSVVCIMRSGSGSCSASGCSALLLLGKPTCCMSCPAHAPPSTCPALHIHRHMHCPQHASLR